MAAENDALMFVGKCNVVGESHYRENIALLGSIDGEYYTPRNLLYKNFVDGDRLYKYDFNEQRAKLVPEPDNEYDPNAIRVDINGLTVGYIPREKTAEVGKLLDDGAVCTAKIVAGTYKLVCEDDAGDLLSERIDNDFSVRLAFFVEKPVFVEEPVFERAPSVPAAVATWICLVLSSTGAVASLVGGIFDLLPAIWMLGAIGAAVVFGMASWYLAGRAYA